MLIEIVKKDQVHSFDAPANEKLLYAGLRAGIPLPYECATGTCGTCRARLDEGKLDEGWAEAPGRINLRAARKEFLLCQATAQSACSLTVPARIKPFRDDDFCPGHHIGIASNWDRLTADVARFEIRLPRPVRFHAGQFFVIKAPGISAHRSYSMVNFEPQTDTLEFVIKKKPGGAFSDWAFDDARNQDEVELFGPLGRATFHSDEGHDLFLIAGGSGIAGLMSILAKAAQTGYFDTHKGTLFFGVRSRADMFYADRLSAMQARYPDALSINIVLSDETSGSVTTADGEPLPTRYGLVHNAALAALAPETTDTMVYIAGPQPMVDACIRPLILDLQISAQMVRYDKFT